MTYGTYCGNWFVSTGTHNRLDGGIEVQSSNKYHDHVKHINIVCRMDLKYMDESRLVCFQISWHDSLGIDMI